jgi:hypothetical protein
MLMFQGFAKVNGVLQVIGVTVGEALPAGTTMHNGIARHPNGSMYVVFG